MTILGGSYLSKRGYVLRKAEIDDKTLYNLKSELRGKPLGSEYANAVSTTFPLYIETVNKLYIPKVYGITRFGHTKELANYGGLEWGTNIPFTGSLYDIQREAVEKLMIELRSGTSGGILSLATGFGKSVCGLYVLSELRGKALIIVNKITLLKQWEEEIHRFLPNAKVGFIQGQSNVDVHDKDIVIAMLQSLSRIDYPDELFSDFRVTLVDEIHNVCSRVFSRVLTKVCSRYTIGLSATPQRGDGCEYIFKWFIGDIVFQSSSERRGLPPIIRSIKLNSEAYREITTTNKKTDKTQIIFTSMLSELVQMNSRNFLICKLITMCVNTESRRVLVLSDRRQHLKTIHKLLEDDSSVGFTFGLFLGQMKMTDLQRAKGCQVILATYQAFGEGVSERDLDTLILVTPKKFIGHLQKTCKNESGKLEQIVGRIFRKDHIEKSPVIIDLQDNFSVYRNQSRQRMAFYKSHFTTAFYKTITVNLDTEPDEITKSLVNNLYINNNNKTDTKCTANENELDDTVDNLEKNLYTSCLLD